MARTNKNRKSMGRRRPWRAGGIDVLAKALCVRLDVGLSSLQSGDALADREHRRERFGANASAADATFAMKQLPTTAMWILRRALAIMWKERTNGWSLWASLIFAGLLCMITVCLIGEWPVEVISSILCVLAVILAIALLTARMEAHNETLSQPLQRLNEENRTVRVLLDGVRGEIQSGNLVVGDIVLLDGNTASTSIPTDGIAFDIPSGGFRVDRSVISGKDHGDDIVDIATSNNSNAVLLAGSKVVSGPAKMLVLCVGEHSQCAQLLALVRRDDASAAEDLLGRLLEEDHETAVDDRQEETDSNDATSTTCSECESSVASETSDDRAACQAAQLPNLPLKLLSNSSEDDDDHHSCTAYAAVSTPKSRPQQKGLADPFRDQVEAKILTKDAAARSDKDCDDSSPLTLQLERLKSRIEKAGVVVTVVVLLVACACFLTTIQSQMEWGLLITISFLGTFFSALSVLTVLTPEGLSLAVAMALTHSIKQMLRESNLLARHLDACATVGNVTAICCDKTGTLTTNSMQVARVWVYGGERASTQSEDPGTAPNCFLSAKSMCDGVCSHVKIIFCEGIAINSTAELSSESHNQDLAQTFPSCSGSGNKTECALLAFVRDCGIDYRAIRGAAVIDHMVAFSSEKKRMSVVVQSPEDNSKCRIYMKGAAETVLSLCFRIQHADGSASDLSGPSWSCMSAAATIIDQFASQGYRTICLAYRDIEGFSVDAVSQWPDEDLERDLTCLSIVGIKDPVRPEVSGAVDELKHAGVVVRMVTGDNVLTAYSIARQCGILPNHSEAAQESQDAVLDGPTFRSRVLDSHGNLVQSEFDKIWPQLRVLARSSPRDKYHLVQGLKQTQLAEQLVATAGDGMNDAPALKKAHVGFAMGVGGTFVAKETSDIILTDDNFHSIVNAIKWGRNVYDSICRSLQFQLTMVAVLCAAACMNAVFPDQPSLSTLQALWVNWIMVCFAAFALKIEPPSPSLMERKPYPRSQSLVSRTMTKHIVGQTLFQFTVLTLLSFYGDAWLYRTMPSAPFSRLLDRPTVLVLKREIRQHHTTIMFNALAWMQLFNLLNCRQIDDKRTALPNQQPWSVNKRFGCVWLFLLVIQVLFVEFGGELFFCVPISWTEWFVCVALGALTLSCGFILRQDFGECCLKRIWRCHTLRSYP